MPEMGGGPNIYFLFWIIISQHCQSKALSRGEKSTCPALPQYQNEGEGVQAVGDTGQEGYLRVSGAAKSLQPSVSLWMKELPRG